MELTPGKLLKVTGYLTYFNIQLSLNEYKFAENYEGTMFLF